MKSKFKKGDRVIVRRTGLSATIEVCCGGNPFLPDCLCNPGYFVRINGAADTVWFKQSQLKAYDKNIKHPSRISIMFRKLMNPKCPKCGKGRIHVWDSGTEFVGNTEINTYTCDTCGEKFV